MAHADPASDMPTVLVALGAEMQVRGPGAFAERHGAGDFFKGLFEPDLASNEVLTEIRVPKTAGRGWSYEVPPPGAGLGAGGCRGARAERRGPSVALTNMADRPLRAAGVEEALAGRRSGGGVGASRGGHEAADRRLRERRVPRGAREGVGAPSARGGAGTMDVGETPARQTEAERARPRSLTPWPRLPMGKC